MSTMGTKREAHRGVQAESSEAADPLRKRVGFGARFLARHSIARKLQILGGMLLALLLTIGILVYHDSRMSAENAARLAEVYRSENSERGGHEVALRVLIILVLAVLVMMTRVHVNEARRQVRQTEKSRRECERVNHQNQGAILRLRNELGDLADGDLTVVATVSGDITDAIADSINHAVGELRRLVGRIDNAAGRVTATTEIVQRGSAELLEVAQRQSREIRDAGHSVREVARTMNHVSDDADQSAQVARQSLAAADKGTLVVQNSIEGRNEIRQQIQESLKRIERLGESSREIGEIVDLISYITEQTSVLALNAAIQAASTGNAGRGFTVLAEEVQRRAERSGEATRKIAAIAKAIQSDAQGAILAMEESMRGVVEETKLSAAAGQAFSEIGAASRNLAERIERISESTRRQANATTVVVGKAQSILALTEQTMTGTQRTAQEVGKLAGLATELKVSVAGFRVNEVNVQK